MGIGLAVLQERLEEAAAAFKATTAGGEQAQVPCP